MRGCLADKAGLTWKTVSWLDTDIRDKLPSSLRLAERRLMNLL